ncbi:MAG: TIGR01212 family radical SAM protein [Syntrophales bacterium]
MSSSLYQDLNSVLRRRFGCRVQKINIDAGLTCPNRDGFIGTGGCIYCNRLGSGTGASSTQSITEQLVAGKAFLGRRYKARKFIAYFQSFTNTYAPADKLERLYEEALAVPDIVGIAVGTRPDCVNEEVLDLLSRLERKTYVSIEYGLQSVHDRTLRLINRGHSFADFLDAVKRTRRRGMEVCVHVILGLPGESKADMLETARTLGEIDVQAVKIHLLYVIRNTRLHRMYNEGYYACLDRESYVDIVCEFLSLLPPQMAVHRLTADPHPAELVAPLWSLEKQATLKAIRDALCRRDLWQGKNYKKLRS